MEKLSLQQEHTVRKLLWDASCLPDQKQAEEVVQHILRVIEDENWTRRMLQCGMPYLTDKQQELFFSLGGIYTSSEIDDMQLRDDVRKEIRRLLKEQGVTHFLYDNRDYVESVRTGETLVAGLDVAAIAERLRREIKKEKRQEPFGWIDCDPEMTYVKFNDRTMRIVVGTFSNHVTGRLRLTLEFFDLFGRPVYSGYDNNRPLVKERYFKPDSSPTANTTCAVIIPYDEFDVTPGFHNLLCKLKMYHLTSMLSECDFVLGHEFK